MSIRRDGLLFIVVAALAFVYVILRAVLVPICHDEARTFQQFIVTQRFLPFAAHWDAANHPLITLTGWISYRLFGPGLFGLRLFSVLCFPLFAFHLYRMGTWIIERRVRWCLWLALLGMPFMIEFFSLFRGYGPAMAFLMMALYHAVRYLRFGGTRSLGLAMLGGALATYGSLTVIVTWAALWAVCALLLPWRVARGKATGAVAVMVLSLGVMVFAAAFGHALQVRGALYYGGDGGLITVTLASLTHFVLGSDSTFVLVPAAVVTLVLPWIATRVLASGDFRERNVLLMLTAFLLLGELVGRIALGEVFGVHYPEDRTGLHLVPLFVIAFACAVDRAAQQQRGIWRWAALPLLFLPLRAAVMANVERIALWPGDAVPARVFDIVEEKQRESERPLLVGGYRLKTSVWNYGNFIRQNQLTEIDFHDHPQPSCDLLLIDPSTFDAPPGFHALYDDGSGYLVLMERQEPLRLALLLDTTFSFATTEEEFITVWEPRLSGLPERELLLWLEAPITSPAHPLEAVLAVEVSDSTRQHLHYVSGELHSRRLQWQGDTLHSLRRIPHRPAEARRLAVYFYNKRFQPLQVDGARLRVYAIDP